MGKFEARQLRGYDVAPKPKNMRRAIVGRVVLGMAVLARSLGARATTLRRDRVGRRTVDDVMNQLAPKVELQWREACKKVRVSYPPHELALIGMKAEKTLSVYARDANAEFKQLKAYPVLAASGVAGPKLRQGNLQVPEGVYKISGLNPNSRFHLSMKVDYPNAFDRAQAERDGRSNLGGDIFIHGGAQSIGCLAIGDPAIEELFVLVARTGRERVRVAIAPHEPERQRFRTAPTASIAWGRELHRQILDALVDIRGAGG